MCAKIGSRFQMGPGQKVAAGAALLAALAGLVHLVIRAMSGDTRRGEGRRGGSLGMCVYVFARVPVLPFKHPFLSVSSADTQGEA